MMNSEQHIIMLHTIANTPSWTRNEIRDTKSILEQLAHTVIWNLHKLVGGEPR